MFDFRVCCFLNLADIVTVLVHAKLRVDKRICEEHAAARDDYAQMLEDCVNDKNAKVKVCVHFCRAPST